MKLLRSAGCVFSGLMLAVSGVHAQEATDQDVSNKARVSVNKSKSVVKKSTRPDAQAVQALRAAEAKAKAEQEARQRAEAEAKKQAEIEAREKPLLDADALVKNGKPAEAYALLEPLEFDRSGEVRFDYLLGIAALDSGKPDKATLAFERVLAVDPNFAGARLDMARAYYQLGDMPRAETEFETVMKQNPPEAAKATIQKYLDAIAARNVVQKTHITGYAEGSAGHDSNVSSAPSQAQIPVPVFGNLIFILNQANLQKSDYYTGVAAGGEITHLVNPNTTLYAGADFRQLNNTTQTQFDSTDLNGHAGVSYATGAETVRVGLMKDQYTLANARLYDISGVNGEWRHALNPSDQLSLFSQFSSFRFDASALQNQDFDQSIVGAGWMHVMPDGKSTLLGSLFTGYENDVGGRPDGNNNLIGLRIGGQVVLNEQWDSFASLGLQRGRYDKQNVAFLTTRNDRQEDLSAGANWHFDKLWTVRPQVMLLRNNSNIAIYSYNRTVVSVALRRDFR